MTNLINGKQYVGQRLVPENYTIESDPYLGSGTILFSAIKKYGKENFKKDILHVCYSQSDADYFEKFYFDKFDVLNNKDVFYNRGLPGQKWRDKGHSEFVSKVMKKFYSDKNNRLKIIAGRKKMTVSEYLIFKKEKDKNDALKKQNIFIEKINNDIKKARYEFFRNETQDLRQEFYTEKMRQKQLLIWNEKKKDKSFLESCKNGKKNINYKELINKAKGKQSKGQVKHPSIIYDALHENNLSVNLCAARSAIRKHIDLRIKTKKGFINNLKLICDKLKKHHNIIIDFNALKLEAIERYSGKLLS